MLITYFQSTICHLNHKSLQQLKKNKDSSSLVKNNRENLQIGTFKKLFKLFNYHKSCRLIIFLLTNLLSIVTM